MPPLNELPKSIAEQIFDEFYKKLNESDLFDENAIEQLRQLHEKKGLSKSSSIDDIKVIFDSIGGEK